MEVRKDVRMEDREGWMIGRELITNKRMTIKRIRYLRNGVLEDWKDGRMEE
ncbi:MAG: hypothetical protein HQ521_20755 [Bacteroidetes bacterium]|nr:hypothetical protein [Bacteroidota bacterium]